MTIKLTTPLTKDALAQLNAGDEVLITGEIFTARDVAHARLLELLGREKSVDLCQGGIGANNTQHSGACDAWQADASGARQTSCQAGADIAQQANAKRTSSIKSQHATHHTIKRSHSVVACDMEQTGGCATQHTNKCSINPCALPYGLTGATIFYAGPTPPAAGRPLGSVGPTTASRMDAATPALMDAGLVACIGKGKRSEDVRQACMRCGCVYFACVGGIAALLAKCVESSGLVVWEDLGTEALRRLTVRDFPAYVGIDTRGRDLYREVEAGAN